MPNDWNAPDACANPQRISLTLLTSYDYAGLRKKREADVQLDPAEVARHWRTITENPVEYVAKADATTHGACDVHLRCHGEADPAAYQFAIDEVQIALLRRPAASAGPKRRGDMVLASSPTRSTCVSRQDGSGRTVTHKSLTFRNKSISYLICAHRLAMK